MARTKLTQAEYEYLLRKPGMVARNAPALKEAAKKKRNSEWAPYRNKTEWRYAQYLWARDDVDRFEYEVQKFKVGEAAWYRPDFKVWVRHGDLESIEFHEVKGYAKGDREGVTRFKTAMMLYPEYRWVLVESKAKGHEWKVLYESE